MGVMTGVNEPVREFWYFTDLDGKPVQQGEAGTGPTDQGFPTSIGHTIWHDYDQSTLDSSPIDSSVFTVPAYCKEATQTCAFPQFGLFSSVFAERRFQVSAIWLTLYMHPPVQTWDVIQF